MKATSPKRLALKGNMDLRIQRPELLHDRSSEESYPARTAITRKFSFDFAEGIVRGSIVRDDYFHGLVVFLLDDAADGFRNELVAVVAKQNR